jgi:membrane-bound ClpP family serine protease
MSWALAAPISNPLPRVSDARSGNVARQGVPADDHLADPMTAMRVGDAGAYIRSLAQLRGRNAQRAEKACARLPACLP